MFLNAYSKSNQKRSDVSGTTKSYWARSGNNRFSGDCIHMYNQARKSFGFSGHGYMGMGMFDWRNLGIDNWLNILRV